jgi:hypothetical protein
MRGYHKGLFDLAIHEWKLDYSKLAEDQQRDNLKLKQAHGEIKQMFDVNAKPSHYPLKKYALTLVQTMSKIFVLCSYPQLYE